MRRVIVNSTPIITLCNIGKLELLKELYGTITVPAAVYNEVTSKDDSACTVLRKCPEWINIENADITLTERKMYKAKLHDGEVEVMILAQRDPKADLVILDDNAAKKTAVYLGLTVTGTMGVLLNAKKHGFVEKVSPLIELIESHGFFISERVKNLILEQAGEVDNN